MRPSIPARYAIYRNILKVLVSGGLHADEVASATGIRVRTITPRFVELERMGFINRTAERRPGKTGEPRIVWEITEQGKDLL